MDDSVGMSLNLAAYKESSHRYTGYDTVLNLKVASIEYIFLNKYVPHHNWYNASQRTHKMLSTIQAYIIPRVIHENST